MILLDTRAWVRWLHPEISGNLPEPLRQWLRSADETIQTYPDLSTVWANPSSLVNQVEGDAP